MAERQACLRGMSTLTLFGLLVPERYQVRPGLGSILRHSQERQLGSCERLEGAKERRW